ncbi:hypothetical protein GCM10011386_34690 [Parapedobacter defluvii]|uniref:cAMP-binding domain of CRP or a regulatory subunit of cAMP-dependent protein kinases n=1 Tax=Parapedobacter defluvii TaxID=2045106 RepID=A0ABQ1MF54_9SPHI|nr:Crp/Fnr family transcriptional regulator [Parapedobacter defluvii]RQP15911.1 MAG: Crp/Fnr family transcriptional regulator [Parapedobacter sp.]GGC39679.1 hypothetical protein GCM10011386_34690 [Parapedobacter defluvii]
MSDVLKAHLARFITINDDEFAEILSYFEHRRAGKKENLLTGGQICGWHYFVNKGILRKFFITDKGSERTTEFAIENWWMTDHLAFEARSVSPFYIQAVEPTELLAISRDKQEEMLQRHPLMEKYFRCVYQKAYGAAQMRMKFLYDFSREELYHHFRKSQPEFLQRVPQYLIASYLGFTPEYLSEIRKKSVS